MRFRSLSNPTRKRSLTKRRTTDDGERTVETEEPKRFPRTFKRSDSDKDKLRNTIDAIYKSKENKKESAGVSPTDSTVGLGDSRDLKIRAKKKRDDDTFTILLTPVSASANSISVSCH